MLNAIIPVKSTSERVPNKNFRDFHNGNSLLDILINKLKAIKDIDKIYISSDKNLSNYCDDKGAIFIERNKSFCNNITPWSQVICEVIKSIPCEQNDTIMWCHVTGPLFNRYAEGIKIYRDSIKIGYDSLVAVEKLNEFILNESFKPINYSWGEKHPYSQDLKPLYRVNGSLFIAQKKIMLEHKYVLGQNANILLCPEDDSIDIDTQSDFEKARAKYNNLYR